jgi:hypothetical protein
MKKYIVKDLETGKLQAWTLKSVLYEINRDRSDEYTAYNHTDWKEGWFGMGIEGDIFFSWHSKYKKEIIMIKNKWICTDPDNKQYGRKISETIYEFKEKGIQFLIDLNDYTSEQMKKFYEPYGFPIGDLTNWIIAECIFEQESRLY